MKKYLPIVGFTLCSGLAGYGHPLDWTFIPLLIICFAAGIGAFFISERL